MQKCTRLSIDSDAVFIQIQWTKWTFNSKCTIIKRLLTWTLQLIIKSILFKLKVILWRKHTIEFTEEILGFFIFLVFNTGNAFLLSI